VLSSLVFFGNYFCVVSKVLFCLLLSFCLLWVSCVETISPDYFCAPCAAFPVGVGCSWCSGGAWRAVAVTLVGGANRNRRARSGSGSDAIFFDAHSQRWPPGVVMNKSMRHSRTRDKRQGGGRVHCRRLPPSATVCRRLLAACAWCLFGGALCLALVKSLCIHRMLT
jgi:hypothetical protein